MTPRLALGVALIAILGFFLFPGHTYLQSDTQIYVPMIDHLRDPQLFAHDEMALRPHMALTIYDEVARAIARVSGAPIQVVLEAEQLVLRFLAIAGLAMIAMKLGLDALAAWFAAAVVALGATLVGPAVLTFEYEPVPRGFAMCLVMLAMGLAARERDLAAGVAAAFALLFHPGTALPFCAIGALAIRRWAFVWPVAAGAALLAAFAYFQAGVTETTPVLARLDPQQESLQRLRASYSFVTTWRPSVLIDYSAQCALIAVALWRMWRDLSPRLRTIFIGLAGSGVLSFFASWILLEGMHWAIVPQWQPARAVLYITLIAAILATACGLRAALANRWAEALAWLALAFFAPIKHATWTWPLLAIPFALAALALVAMRFRITVPLAGVAIFIAIPALGVVNNYPHVETPELDEVAAWAHAQTPVDAVFLFPDFGTALDPGIFRVRAQRPLYVDWKSGGQINYFPRFTEIWWQRWNETGRGKLKPDSAALADLASKSIGFVVVHAQNAIPGHTPLFANSKYAVYATSSRDSR